MFNRGVHKGDSYPDRYVVECLDRWCWARKCMWPGQDKGTFSPGRGYTSYHKHPRAVCSRQHLHGCPSPKPEPDPEQGRCCFAPEFKGRGRIRNKVRYKTCQTCGAEVPVWVASELSKLPRRPGVSCDHKDQTDQLILLKGWSTCPTCRGYWNKPTGLVEPFEIPAFNFEGYMAELERRTRKITVGVLVGDGSE